MKQSSKEILKNLIDRYPKMQSCYRGIEQSAEAMAHCYRNGGKILVCGNGGSAADALHIVGELMKAFILPRKIAEADQKKICEYSKHADYINANLQGALPAISLVNEMSLLTAYANDVAPDLDFAQQVYGYGNKGDILIGISTSGNSNNVIYACEVAKAKEMVTVGLTGENGGKIREIADFLINVPQEETYKIQELHLPVYHAICLALENEFFGAEE